MPRGPWIPSPSSWTTAALSAPRPRGPPFCIPSRGPSWPPAKPKLQEGARVTEWLLFGRKRHVRGATLEAWAPLRVHLPSDRPLLVAWPSCLRCPGCGLSAWTHCAWGFGGTPGSSREACPLPWAPGTGARPGVAQTAACLCSAPLCCQNKMHLHVRPLADEVYGLGESHRSQVLAFKTAILRCKDARQNPKFYLIGLLILSVLSQQINGVKFQFLIFCYLQQH